MKHESVALAWCAGFFDGEGHVSYRRSYPNKTTGKVSPALHASVSQSSENLETLEFFQATVKLGRLKGPYKMPNGKPQHRLLFGTEEVLVLLILLKPYLMSKKTKDFQRALMQYHMHDTEATAEDRSRALRWQKKRGCIQCRAEWNGVMCTRCGYIR